MKSNENKLLFDVTSPSGEVTSMEYLFAYEYEGEEYHALTPGGEESEDGSWDVAICRKQDDGSFLYAGASDEVFEEFCRQFELREVSSEGKEPARKNANGMRIPKSTLPDLDYLELSKGGKFLYKLKMFFLSIPYWLAWKFGILGRYIADFCVKFAYNIRDIWTTFKNGSWRTRLSYLVMGFSNAWHGQWVRAAAFFILEVAFILYMIFIGAYWLGKFGTLGTVVTTTTWDENLDVEVTTYGDNSFKILLYGLISIALILCFVYTWRLNVKQCMLIDQIEKSGKKFKSNKDDLHSLIDNQFHKTLLALPVFGMTMFTILPIIFMILVAFTNYDYAHDGYVNLFTWVGWDNFNDIFTIGDISVAFGEILAWTLVWALFATFSCYFLGMFVAMLINKKGIHLKKLWRTMLVITIAVPQFISLLYVSNLFADNGVINAWLKAWGWTSTYVPFWSNGWLAKVMVIVVNIWVGIPYLMLITTGILMNIPEDLYESSKMDGANGFQQFSKITLPYMLFVTGPYLLTSFTGNINNFNVIYLLTQGGPSRYDWGQVGGYIAGDTTILITWLYGITTGSEANYKMAAVIGILIFLVVTIISIVVYNFLPSNRREDDYS